MHGNIQAKKHRPIREFLPVILFSILFLFFLQLLTDFIAAVYAFGLLGTSIPPEIVSVLFLFSPVVFIVWQRGLKGKLLFLAGELFFLSRVIENLLDTRGRMLASGFGVALFLILLPTFLKRASDQHREHGGVTTGLGLGAAVILAIILRAYHSGIDGSTDGSGVVIGWVLALAAGFLWPRYLSADRNTPDEVNQPEEAQSASPGSGRLAALCLGLMGCLVLLYFGFAAPNVLARWTGLSYASVITVLALAYAGAGLILVMKPAWILRLNFALWIILNLAFGVALVGVILAEQMAFPSDVAVYPLYAMPLSRAGWIMLYIALALSPIILVNFIRLWSEISSRPLGTRALGGGFSLASLYLLVMIFSHVFTTVYDYIPVVGPFFRDKFWLVYLMAWMGMFLPVLLTGRAVVGLVGSSASTRALPAYSGLVVLGLAVLAVIGVIFRQPAPAAADTDAALTVLTYNIQQGYSETGQINYDGQLALIQSLNPDLVGLQETDTNRVAGGNADMVRYLADELGYDSYYGPSPVTGTFGVALLSRYPIQEPNTFYMYSEREQTATIAAHVLVGGQRYNIFVTHLGNGGPIIQQQAILTQVENLSNVILMGDFNFRPDTEAYRQTSQQLTDSWLAAWPDEVDGSGIDPRSRIDHIFISPELPIRDARYLLDPASDHPALWASLGE
jgi:endonuclease/exonuclease/phosphatase family metal-dependent hydrolase